MLQFSDLRVIANSERYLHFLLVIFVVNHCFLLDYLHVSRDGAFWLREKTIAAHLSPLHITARVEHVVFKVFSQALPRVVAQLIVLDLGLYTVNTLLNLGLYTVNTLETNRLLI